MKIVCASSLALGEEAFSTLGDVVVLPERAITREVVRDADALVARSKVSVTREFLAGTRLSFVATATAGTDHLDFAALAERDIAWASAPGSNARSVAEYVVAALLRLAVERGVPLQDRTLAVVGVGHVGAQVADLAHALGLHVLLNDPPRQLAEKEGGGLRPLDEILPKADFVSLHVPLTDDGPFATRRLVDCRLLSRLKPGCVFLNASRGEVVDEDALLLALERGWVAHAVLDVFQHEPRIRRDVVQRAFLATPHIAGYSFEGRVRGTQLCYEAACRFFEREPAWHPGRALGQPHGRVRVAVAGRPDEAALDELVRASYDIRTDDAALRAGLDLDDASLGRHFQQLRSDYRERYEFAGYRVELDGASPLLVRRAEHLGFSVEGASR